MATNMKPIRIHWARVLPAVIIICICILIIYALTRSSQCSTEYANNTDIKAVSYLCNHLTEEPTNGDEGSIPTFKYRLEQVHVIIRHGDRWYAVPSYPSVTIPCNITNNVIRHVPEMEGYVQTMQENAKKMKSSHPFYKWDLYPNSIVCKPAFLTPKGAAQHVRIGAFLKSIYVRKWKLLSHGPELWDQVEMISTKKGRTLMSGLALLYGLLPEFDLAKMNITTASDNRMCHKGSGFDCVCPSMLRILNVVSGVFGQWRPSFVAQEHVKKFRKEVAQVLGTPIHMLPLTSHLMDISTVHMCHGLPLPGPPGQSICFSPATVRSIIDSINKNGAKSINDPMLRRLSHLKMYPFFQDILSHMQKIQVGKTKRRLFLYSGHDSTIDPILVVLNVTNGSWPRYASRVVFELYSSASPGPAGTETERSFFVKVVHDGKDVTGQTRGCAPLAPDGLCRFKDFKRPLSASVLRTILNEQTYKEACRESLL